MTAKKNPGPPPHQTLTALVEPRHIEALRQRAKENDRTVAAEVRILLRREFDDVNR